MQVESWVRADIGRFKPYKPPPLEEIAARAGLAVDQLVRLNANENPYGPSPKVAEALARLNPALYPDQARLREAVAAYAGVATEQVVLGHGSNELINQVLHLLLEPGQGLIVCPPTFSMYEFFASLSHYPVWAVPQGPGFSLDVEGVESLVREGSEGRPRVLVLASPGNPDGQIIAADVVERLLQLPLVVVLDEAYVEFGGPSALPLLADHENLIILRTFSKWAGLAGLRVGYGLLAPAMAGYLERIRIPFNVNSAAVAAVLATLDDLETVQANVARLIAGREWLLGALAEIPWLEPFPSRANFILCRVRGHSGAELGEALAERGILIRAFSDPRLAPYVRITVGRPEQNRLLLDRLWALPWQADSSERGYDALCTGGAKDG